MNKQEMDIGGVSFAYRESGRGDPMVLVHGNLSDLRSWVPLEPLVAEHFRVINYSRRFAYPNHPADDEVSDALAPMSKTWWRLSRSFALGKCTSSATLPARSCACSLRSNGPTLCERSHSKSHQWSPCSCTHCRQSRSNSSNSCSLHPAHSWRSSSSVLVRSVRRRRRSRRATMAPRSITSHAVSSASPHTRRSPPSENNK